MDDHRKAQRNRTLRSGKAVFNLGRSVVDCTVRNMSTHGACLEMTSLVGVPERFTLLLTGDNTKHSCRLVWKNEHRAGVEFETPIADRRDASVPDRRTPAAEDGAKGELVRSELLALRAGLEEVAFGVVLLDQDLRAQFINRAFRAMWKLPDAKANAHPSYFTLLYHGREIGAYEVPADKLDAYVAERIAHVKAGNPSPIDLRLANGEALRFQCIALPAGGRMLSYTPVTDIVRHADELDVLRAALDVVEQGIVLLDADLNATFVNRAARAMWHVPDTKGLTYPDIVHHAFTMHLYDVPDEALDTHIAERIASVRAGDARAVDLPLNNGRVIRAQCTALPGGGRMMSYVDVTDLARRLQAAE